MADTEASTVGRTAELIGVSVRTLHHWDSIGLVNPSERTRGGYRVYSADDILRLHRVLVYRELGLSLSGISRILDDPSIDARQHLRRQRSQLTDQIDHLQSMVAAVDQLLASGPGIQLTPAQQVELFGTQWRPEWVEEASERWGDTKQWQQYAERAAGLTTDDWKEVAAATEALNNDLAKAHRAGVVPGSPAANALAERHRSSVQQYFDCTHEMQVCLARMYCSDPDYLAYFDAVSPGLANWLREVVHANASAHGVDPATAQWKA